MNPLRSQSKTGGVGWLIASVQNVLRSLVGVAGVQVTLRFLSGYSASSRSFVKRFCIQGVFSTVDGSNVTYLSFSLKVSTSVSLLPKFASLVPGKPITMVPMSHKTHPHPVPRQFGASKKEHLARTFPKCSENIARKCTQNIFLCTQNICFMYSEHFFMFQEHFWM